jgi:hypothetical protein
VLLLVAALEPSPFSLVNDQRVFGIIIGTIIGLFITVVIAGVNQEKIFSEGLSGLLSALETYAKSMRVYPGMQTISQNQADKIKVERALVAKYPEWVFEIGFNPSLRSGFRFMLVNIDHSIEALFSLASHFADPLNPQLTEQLSGVLNQTLQHNAELFAILDKYFKEKVLPPNIPDFTSDIKSLEEEVKQRIPPGLELLDISPDYINLAAIVRDIKDLRQTLLQLIAALPAT